MIIGNLKIDFELFSVKQLDNTISNLLKASELCFRLIEDDLLKELKKETPRGHSGNLKKGYEIKIGKDGLELEITNKEDYWRFVYEGRGPIVASGGKVLAFLPIGKSGWSEFVFTDSVGPMRPNKMVDRAFDNLSRGNKLDKYVKMALALSMRG